MHPVLIDFGFFEIRSYGFFFALAFVIALMYGFFRRKKFGLSQDNVVDIALYIMIGAIVGAKLLSIIIDFKEIIRTGLTFDILRSGFVFLGGLTGGIFGGAFYVYKNKYDYFNYMDFIAPILPLSHGIGRLGCFFNGCCYGSVTNSCFGVVFPVLGDNIPRLPVQLFESVFLILTSIIVVLLERKNIFKKVMFPFYILCYSIFRFIIEFFRGDEIRGFFMNFSTSQWISLIFGIVSIIIILKMRMGRKE
ncbi:MAG: prolipoprotein diacylglyceryl transferase [Candidatus Muirbacterium halophilum]|nr:prolipoprotein diacylglyceryl transferase [Candidatus Muirbacterium halophilum]MCK9475361.1 prolipoprotein diacylglyceryl transferase [Candidatus Muirbacterium halophilum]